MPKLDQVVERLPPAYVTRRLIKNDCATLVFVELLGLRQRLLGPVNS